MKASESNSHYIAKVRECTNYSVRGIKNYLKADPPPRATGSEGEAKVRDYLKGELSGFCDSVDAEPFKAQPLAQRLSYLLFCIFTIISVISYTVSFFVNDAMISNYSLNKIMVILAFAFSVLGFLSVKGLYKSFAKVVESSNVIATRKSKNEAKHKIVFCANTDAPFEDKFTVSAYKIIKTVCYIGLVFVLICDILIILKDFYRMDIINESILRILGYIQFVFVPFFIVLVIATGKNVVKNAVADNLSGSFACVGALRYLSVCDLSLENTDIEVLLTSAKNASNEGAKAYLKKHVQEDKAIDTIFICVDTLNDIESISAMPEKSSEKANEVLKEASQNAKIKLLKSKAEYLCSDAKVFAKGGLESVTITTLTEKAPDFYHSDTDDINNLDTKSTEAAINLLLECAFAIDQK